MQYKFREDGCDPGCYNTPFLNQVRCGVKNIFPQHPDARKPFLLPKYLTSSVYTAVSTRKGIVPRFAAILGFIGMLRPHTFTSLKASSLCFIRRKGGSVIQETSEAALRNRLRFISPREVLGFYINFKSKTMNCAWAYFPNLSSPKSNYAAMCPVKEIMELIGREYLRGAFLKDISSNSLAKYLQDVSSSSDRVPLYALRIGGRTWKISQGLDRQFVDYLGTWKSPEASARYYRAQPSVVLRKVRSFYFNLKNPEYL